MGSRSPLSRNLSLDLEVGMRECRIHTFAGVLLLRRRG